VARESLGSLEYPGKLYILSVHQKQHVLCAEPEPVSNIAIFVKQFRLY